MTTATSAIQPPLLPSLAVTNAVHNRINSFALTASPPTSGGRLRFAVRSTNKDANSKSDDEDDDDDDDDVSFLLKLGGGSFAGAAAIKYGSILVPEITRPNIIQALIMISTPVLLAVLLLVKQSRVQQ